MADILDYRRKAGVTRAPTPAVAPPNQQAPTNQVVGTGFVGLDRYLQANRSAAQAMAQKVGDTVAGKAGAAEQAITGAKDTFAAKSQAAAVTYDPSKAATAAQAGDIQRQLVQAGGYQGPKDWAGAAVDVADVTKKTVQGANAVAGLGTQGGIASLLKESYNGGGGTSGGSALDAALTGAVGGGRFQELQGAYKDLSDRLISGQKSTEDVYKANAKGARTAASQYGQRAFELAQQERAAEDARLAAEAAEAERQRLERERLEAEKWLRQRNPKPGPHTGIPNAGRGW